MPGPTPTSVRVSLDLRLVLGGDRGLLVPAVLDYDVAEPFAITATFRTADGDVTWMFARELLAAGLEHPSGEGDVAVWPSLMHGHDTVSISLTSPNGQALLEADRGELERFLARTDRICAPGLESDLLDVDVAIAALLDDAV